MVDARGDSGVGVVDVDALDGAVEGWGVGCWVASRGGFAADCVVEDVDLGCAGTVVGRFD